MSISISVSRFKLLSVSKSKAKDWIKQTFISIFDLPSLILLDAIFLLSLFRFFYILIHLHLGILVIPIISYPGAFSCFQTCQNISKLICKLCTSLQIIYSWFLCDISTKIRLVHVLFSVSETELVGVVPVQLRKQLDACFFPESSQQRHISSLLLWQLIKKKNYSAPTVDNPIVRFSVNGLTWGKEKKWF